MDSMNREKIIVDFAQIENIVIANVVIIFFIEVF